MTTSRITELPEPRRGWRYQSGAATYTERLKNGRLIAASLRGNGLPCPSGDEDNSTPAFDLHIDGESLTFGWEAVGFVVSEGEGGAAVGRLTLRSTLKPIELEIETLAGGNGFFRRRIRLTNISKTATLGLSAAAPLTGVIWPLTDPEMGGAAPYRVGRMQDVAWCHEGNFQWQDVPMNAELSFGSRRGRSGFGTPFAVVECRARGGYLVLGLAWSANWRMSFHCDRPEQEQKAVGGRLYFHLRPEAPAPMRLVAPGETLAWPDAHFGMNHVGFDDAIQGWHTHVRRHALCTAGEGVQPIIYTGALIDDEQREEYFRRGIDIAATIGAEVVNVDAGWYGDEGVNWYEATGDWEAGNRLPNDLFPIFDYARSKGLGCCLWVEIESAAAMSKVAREHPDWFVSRFGRTDKRLLDLAKPEVCEHIEKQLCRLIDRYCLDMLRLDFNMEPGEGGFNRCADGRHENTLWRHVEGIHGIFDRIRRRYPKLQLQNCAGGGGRTDLGMLGRFTTTWISDWLRMPGAARILNGMSMALPPEVLDRRIGIDCFCTSRDNWEMQAHLALLAHPALRLLCSDADPAPEILDRIRTYLDIYRNFIRPFHRSARLYHHTPVIPGADGDGWCALELVSADRAQAVASVFRLANATESEFRLRFRGLDAGKTYRVSIAPDGPAAVREGWTLAEEGMTIRLDTAVSSRMVLCERECQ